MGDSISTAVRQTERERERGESGTQSVDSERARQRLQVAAAATASCSSSSWAAHCQLCELAICGPCPASATAGSPRRRRRHGRQVCLPLIAVQDAVTACCPVLSPVPFHSPCCAAAAMMQPPPAPHLPPSSHAHYASVPAAGPPPSLSPYMAGYADHERRLRASPAAAVAALP